MPYEQFKDIYYEAYYGPSFASGKTKGFNGVVHLADPAVPTVASYLFTFVHKNGGRFHGMTPDGKTAHQGDPKLNDMIDKMRVEFDRPKQVELAHEIQRYFTGQAYYIPRGDCEAITLTRTSLGNMGVFSPLPARTSGASATCTGGWTRRSRPLPALRRTLQDEKEPEGPALKSGGLFHLYYAGAHLGEDLRPEGLHAVLVTAMVRAKLDYSLDRVGLGRELAIHT